MAHYSIFSCIFNLDFETTRRKGYEDPEKLSSRKKKKKKMMEFKGLQPSHC
jgi:hypothetical protein